MECNVRKPSMAKDVCFLLYEQTNLLTLSCFLEAFSAVDLVGANEQRPAYDISLCSFEGGEITGAYGCSFKTVSLLDSADRSWDTFIIGGGWGFELALCNSVLLRCISEHGRRARRVCAVGGGVFLAAAAGLLDGRQVATHPIVARELQDRFPKLKVDSRSLLIRDGNILTSPGMSSSVDVALSLIESDFSYRTAVEVAKFLVVYAKRSFYDPQVSTDLILQERSDRFGPLHDWMRSNLRRELSLEVLAVQAGMSVRNFTRVYQQHMGISPRRAVEIIRVHAACRALVLGKEQIQTVALRCGFESERTFVRAFTRVIGFAPSHLRSAVRNNGQAGPEFDFSLNELFHRAITPSRDPDVSIH